MRAHAGSPVNTGESSSFKSKCVVIARMAEQPPFIKVVRGHALLEQLLEQFHPRRGLVGVVHDAAGCGMRWVQLHLAKREQIKVPVEGSVLDC